jgi:hypothetical protein
VVGLVSKKLVRPRKIGEVDYPGLASISCGRRELLKEFEGTVEVFGFDVEGGAFGALIIVPIEGEVGLIDTVKGADKRVEVFHRTPLI